MLVLDVATQSLECVLPASRCLDERSAGRSDRIRSQLPDAFPAAPFARDETRALECLEVPGDSLSRDWRVGGQTRQRCRTALAKALD
jgi:hypothetical protein